MMKRKCFLSTVAIFAVIFVTDWIIHGMILKSAYQETAHLWRPESEIKMGYMFAGQFLVALFLAWIFAMGYKGKGIMEGVRFGLLVGGLQAGHNLIMYAVAPYECKLTCSWIILGFAQTIIVGVVAAKVWGKKAGCWPDK